jgi:hypothetical protein
MFGFGARKFVRTRAHFIVTVLAGLEKTSRSVEFADFVADCRKRGFVDQFLDQAKRRYEFVEPLPPGAAYSDLTSVVQYRDPPDLPEISVEGLHYYFGCDVRCSYGKLVAA